MVQGCKKQHASFPGLTRDEVADLGKVLEHGPDVLGCNLSGNYLGEAKVAKIIEALSNCRRLTSLWLAHNELGPMVINHLERNFMREFPARVREEDDPLIVTAKVMAALRKELEQLPAEAIRQRAVAMGADETIIQRAVEEAEEEALEKAAAEKAKEEARAKEEEELGPPGGFPRPGRSPTKPVAEPEESEEKELGPAHKALINRMVRQAVPASQSLANGSAAHGDKVGGSTAAAYLSLNQSITQMPQHRPFGLRVLSLGNNRIGDIGARRLGAIMTRPNCPLVSVHLAGNDISDVGVEDLAKAIALEDTQLVNLNLAGNFITNRGARKIADALDLNRSLSTLSLERNPIVRAVDADEKRPEIKSFSPESFCVTAARKTAARSFVYTYTLMNREQADPKLHRVRVHCLCSDGAGKYTDTSAVIARTDYLLTQMMQLNGVGGSTAEVKTSLEARGLVNIGVPAAHTRPSEQMTPIGLLWSEDHILLARIAFRLSLCPTQLKGRQGAAATERSALWAKQLEAATYPPEKTSAKSLFQRAVTLVQVDLHRPDGCSNSDLLAAYEALTRCLEIVDKEDAEGGAQAKARAEALEAVEVEEEFSGRPASRGSPERPRSRASPDRAGTPKSSIAGGDSERSGKSGGGGGGGGGGGTSKQEMYVAKLKHAAHAAALIANYDGVHRHEVETVLAGVKTEMALTVEARLGRHSGDRHFANEEWEEAHHAYASALKHGHLKKVYVNFQDAQSLFKWAESMHHGTGKSKKKGRLKDKMKTVVATSAHNTTSSKISSDVLMKNNTAVIVSDIPIPLSTPRTLCRRPFGLC